MSVATDMETDLSAAAVLARILKTFAVYRKVKPGTRGATPLWSVVGSLTGHGSGYSSRICEQHGYDPWTLVKPFKM